MERSPLIYLGCIIVTAALVVSAIVVLDVRMGGTARQCRDRCLPDNYAWRPGSGHCTCFSGQGPVVEP